MNNNIKNVIISMLVFFELGHITFENIKSEKKKESISAY